MYNAVHEYIVFSGGASPSPTKNIYDINFCYCHVILTTIVTITYIGKLWMITTVTQLFIVQYSLRQQRQPRRFAICRQIATFPKAEFVAAHSRKGGICSGSQPQTPHCLPIVLSAATSYVVPHIPSPTPLPPQYKTLSVSPDLCLPPHKALLRADGFQ